MLCAGEIIGEPRGQKFLEKFDPDCVGAVPVCEYF